VSVPDFVIVGSGAAGGVLAKELAEAGFRVVVLEQGPYLKNSDFEHDELKVMFRYGITNDPQIQPVTYRRTEADQAQVGGTIQYAKLVGGGSVHFTANYWRFHEIDFIERSTLGPIGGASLEDWPFPYAELEPYYTMAEWDLGVSGLAGANPFDPPRSKPYPLPPMPVKSSGVLFEHATRQLGWHPFPAPLAILSKPYMGRNACQHCGFCIAMGCEHNAKSSTLATVIPRAEATGRCEIRPHSTVFRVETKPNGRVSGVLYYDRNGKERRQKARAVIVSCNGAETPRLLLLSESTRFPQGLANSSGLVGRNLMFNGWTLVQGEMPEPLNEFKSVMTTRVIQDFYLSDPQRGFYGGGGLDARFDAYPIFFALNCVPPGMPRWGADYKRWVRSAYTRTIMIEGHSTSLPVESNSISLDPVVKDAWGLPAMRVTNTDHPDDLKMRLFLVDRSLEVMNTMGAVRPLAQPVTIQDGSNHLLGTARMGDDPRKSVVDRFHRAHDVPNLFICDGSSLVTGGRGQPTCTIQALAYRAADHIARFARAGEIPSGS